MPTGRAFVHMEVSISQVMQALRDLTIYNEKFDYKKWSIWDAEVMELVAKKIKEGYHNENA